MDIAVTGLTIYSRSHMIEQLQLFANKIQEWGCVESLKSIETATIPVIKLVRICNKSLESQSSKGKGLGNAQI